jgi:hypothetical protein
VFQFDLSTTLLTSSGAPRVAPSGLGGLFGDDSLRVDGRGAFFQALHTHYLGANHVNNMASIAQAKLAQAKYYGEKRRYNFESYVSFLTEQFQVLNTLRHYGYAGIDEASKVRCLNTEIKTHKLNAPKAQIMSSHTLQDNFDDSIGLYQAFTTQSNRRPLLLRQAFLSHVGSIFWLRLVS